MPTLDVWLTVVHGVTDTTAKDFQRSEKIFAGVPLNFRISKHSLTRAQTQAILGTDGKLAIAGGLKQFDHDLPSGAGSGIKRAMTIQDPGGAFTTEVWSAIRDWTDLGGLHVFYVPEFDPPGLEGGICLRAGDLIDPIIFVSQQANQKFLSTTKGTRGVLEHEIGHAFGLGHSTRAKTLMLGVISSDASDAGTTLSLDELQTIGNSRLLGLAAALGDRK